MCRWIFNKYRGASSAVDRAFDFESGLPTRDRISLQTEQF